MQRRNKKTLLKRCAATESTSQGMQSKMSGVNYEQTIGAPLGSATADAFSELLFSTSGCMLSSQKMNLILEKSVKESLAEVFDDVESSRIAQDFLRSFKSRYASNYEFQRAFSKPLCQPNGVAKPSVSQSIEWDCPQQQSNFDIEIFNLYKKEELSGNGDVNTDTSYGLTESSTSSDESLHKSVLMDTKTEQYSKSKALHVLDPETFSTNGEDYCSGSVSHELKNGGSNGKKCPCRKNSYKCKSHCMTQNSLTTASCSRHGSSKLDVDVNGVAGHAYAAAPSEFHKNFLTFFERCVLAHEHQNRIRSAQLVHTMKRHALEEENIKVMSLSNDLMQLNIKLSKSEASFNENVVLEEKEKSAHMVFITTCADELVAGLFVMLFSVICGVRKYSLSRLNDLVATCQAPIRDQQRSVSFGMVWVYGFMDSIGDKLQALFCQITVTRHILVGSVLVVVVACSLLRQSIARSTQTMPATVLIIILGGICGAVGKASVDRLGGDGIQWLLLWEIFCTTHVLLTYFTPYIYKILHGPDLKSISNFEVPYWLRRVVFHATLVFVLPILSGQLPFGSVNQISNDWFQTTVGYLSLVACSISKFLQTVFVVFEGSKHQTTHSGYEVFT